MCPRKVQPGFVEVTMSYQRKKAGEKKIRVEEGIIQEAELEGKVKIMCPLNIPV